MLNTNCMHCCSSGVDFTRWSTIANKDINKVPDIKTSIISGDKYNLGQNYSYFRIVEGVIILPAYKKLTIPWPQPFDQLLPLQPHKINWKSTTSHSLHILPSMLQSFIPSLSLLWQILQPDLTALQSISFVLISGHLQVFWYHLCFSDIISQVPESLSTWVRVVVCNSNQNTGEINTLELNPGSQLSNSITKTVGQVPNQSSFMATYLLFKQSGRSSPLFHPLLKQTPCETLFSKTILKFFPFEATIT